MVLGCSGSVIIRSSVKEKEIKVDSAQIKRRKRTISEKEMTLAEVNGNCCWEMGNKNIGGRRQHLKMVQNHQLPWHIKSVRMTKC